jgi:hypothetical protein
MFVGRLLLPKGPSRSDRLQRRGRFAQGTSRSVSSADRRTFSCLHWPPLCYRTFKLSAWRSGSLSYVRSAVVLRLYWRSVYTSRQCAVANMIGRRCGVRRFPRRP